MQGGDDGPAIVPGRPEQSLLIAAVKHESYEMPPEPAAKLSAPQIAALEKWIKLGAPWPTTPTDLAAAPKTIAERARDFWAFQPVANPPVPQTKHDAWSPHAVDRFLAQRWESAGIEPAPDADPQSLIRRLCFVLTGLPPKPEEVHRFVHDCALGLEPEAYAALVERLLASPRFGEHWARRWMDWVRYCETHGSEGDPSIPEAWRYRDYLIRALNADVPYDQLVREHLAGDLLPRPRVDAKLGLSESALGTAHLRMVEHGFQPVDPLDDLVKFTDNQIDVVMKTFQALTVTCARCHDHKFDPISQADFYALYPLFAASRPAQVQLDLPERLHRHDAALRALKTKLRAVVGDAWLASIGDLPVRMAALPEPTRQDASRKPEHLLYPWFELRGLKTSGSGVWNDAWRKTADKIGHEVRTRKSLRASETVRAITLDEREYAAWSKSGAGAPAAPFAPGMFAVMHAGDTLLRGIYPRGIYTHELSTKHGAIFSSPKFKLEGESLGVRVVGGGHAQVRLVIENYPLSRGGIYGQSALPFSESPQWIHWDTTYWKGFEAYLELETFDDATLIGRSSVPIKPSDGRSFIGITDIIERHTRGPTDLLDPRIASAAIVVEPALKSADDLAKRYQALARTAIEAWRSGNASDEQAELLNTLLQAELLPNSLAPGRPTSLGSEAVALAAEYRNLEAKIPKATRAPGVVESAGFDQRLMTRGDHRKLAETIPRRYLEGLGGKSLAAAGSGRLQLAEQLASTENPLTARVAVNRLWHYVFGRGIVATVDNFGALGTPPTHPELLDHLAAKFVAEGWSLKQALRYLVMSRTFRLASAPSDAARKQDPTNLLLSHARVRRLDAEAIRDTLIATAGRLKHDSAEGPGFNADDGPQQQTRRSVFVAIRRNSLPQFLETFDAPKPFTTLGARDVTNTPGQALTMLNDVLVIELAKFWAASLSSPTYRTDDEPTRIRRMYLTAFSREPTTVELSAAQSFLEELALLHKVAPADRLRSERVWQDFAHALFNMKEFIYVR